MNGHIDLTAVVLLLVGGVTAYVAYRDQTWEQPYWLESGWSRSSACC